DMFKPELDGSIGQEMLLNDVSIQDEDGSDLPDSVPGEICVRGPNVMIGYFNRPEATAAAFRNGWLRTGDVASRRDGYFMSHDRIPVNPSGKIMKRELKEQNLWADAAVLG